MMAQVVAQPQPTLAECVAHVLNNRTEVLSRLERLPCGSARDWGIRAANFTKWAGDESRPGSLTVGADRLLREFREAVSGVELLAAPKTQAVRRQGLEFIARAAIVVLCYRHNMGDVPSVSPEEFERAIGQTHLGLDNICEPVNQFAVVFVSLGRGLSREDDSEIPTAKGDPCPEPEDVSVAS